MLSCSDNDGFMLRCSARRSACGAGRNSSMSTYSSLHAFSASFVGIVGRPLATRRRAGFVSASFSLADGRAASNGIIEASWL